MKSSPLGSELARCLFGVVMMHLTAGLSEGQLVAGRVPEALSVFPDAAQEDEVDDVEAEGDFFTENLNPHGNWVEVSGYGNCWRPTGVAEGWRPYSEGYWAYTDVGWTWVSYEPFGSVVYHYGRWLRLMDGGWAWVPGREWGPAWVSWRHGDEYVGWAPLPPEARWRSDTGISTWVDMTAGIGPGHYQFCSVRDFGAPLIARVILSSARNALFVQITQNVTNISYHNRRPFCGGLAYDWVAPRCQKPIPRLRVVCEERVDRIRERSYLDGRRDGFQAGLAAGRQGELLVVPAPRTVNIASVSGKVGKPTSRVEGSSVDNGWRGVSDRDRRQLESSMARDVAGLTPTVAPARKPGLSELRNAPQPVGRVEKGEVLSKGGAAPVVAPVGVGRSGAASEIAGRAGSRSGELGRDDTGPSKAQSGNQEREIFDATMRRDAASFAEKRRLEGANVGSARPSGAAVSQGTLSSELSPPVGARGGGLRDSSPMPQSPGPSVSPTRKAIDGLREQDRRAEELRRQSEEFSKARSPLGQGGTGTDRTQSPFGSAPSNRFPTSDGRSSAAEVQKFSVQGKAAQSAFDAQRREQQRLLEVQAARERSVRTQAPVGASGNQRLVAPVNQLGGAPSVAPRQGGTAAFGAAPAVGGLGAPMKGNPSGGTSSSAAKKKEEDFKK